jgi:hypothetical protein
LHVSPVQGAGRLDNPERYLVLYAADSAAGAVAEAFGNHGIWTDQLFSGRPNLPGSCTALAEIDADGARFLDLDDPRTLLERGLRPSMVVTRDRAVTQAWALRAFEEKRWAGARWWSYYDPRWGSYGIWNARTLRARSVGPLHRDHPAVVEARSALGRPWR